MGVICAACGRESQDLEFCDHCNADLAPPREPYVPSRCPYLPEGQTLSEQQVESLAQPESFIVVPGEDRSWRVHWLARENLQRWFDVLQERQRFQCPAIPMSRWLEDDQGLWVLAETSGNAFRPWSWDRDPAPLQDEKTLLRLTRELTLTLEELHKHELVWLNFDPEALEYGDGCLRITNLDLEIYPRCRFPERVAVRPNYAAPEVSRGLAADIGTRTDVFHLAMFCYTWLGWHVPDGFGGKGLDAFNYQIPALRVFRPRLAPGIWPVLQRGLAVDPQARFDRPREFLEALESAVARAEQRYQWHGTLSWDIGGDSRTGKAKEAILQNNEDRVLIVNFPEPPRTLAAVADGISTCDVGTGGLASFLAMLVLENFFLATHHRQDFIDNMARICQDGSRKLLDWAIENDFEDELRRGQGLMGTTLLAAWIEDREVALANLGDSRAYLIDASGIEQLTVDGDLAAGLLASGTPPDQIKELGQLARALRECIGGCEVSPDGTLGPLPDCQPTVSQWPLCPGDILVLCTDGLVEEGAFLEPEIVDQILRNHPSKSAQELAETLVDAANDLQHLPSRWEPEGFGDNISCVVIKFV